jgi:putative membrane protein
MNLVKAEYMSEGEVLQEKTYAKSLAKGLLAGLIGGLVATAAKSFVERIYPPRTHGEPEPPAMLPEEIAGHELVGGDKKVAEEAIHWGFGAMTGAAYGALVEYYPMATAKEGAGFGMALNSLTHGTALPAMGLSAEPEDQSFREKTSEMASHLMFGVVTETVRRFVRKMLG